MRELILAHSHWLLPPLTLPLSLLAAVTLAGQPKAHWEICLSASSSTSQHRSGRLTGPVLQTRNNCGQPSEHCWPARGWPNVSKNEKPAQFCGCSCFTSLPICVSVCMSVSLSDLVKVRASLSGSHARQFYLKEKVSRDAWGIRQVGRFHRHIQCVVFPHELRNAST